MLRGRAAGAVGEDGKQKRSRWRRRDSCEQASCRANGAGDEDGESTRCHHSAWASRLLASKQVGWVGLLIFLEHQEAGPPALYWLRLGPFFRELTLSFRFTNPHVENHWLPALQLEVPLEKGCNSTMRSVVGNRQGMRFSATKTAPISPKANIPTVNRVQSGGFTCVIQLV